MLLALRGKELTHSELLDKVNKVNKGLKVNFQEI